MYATSRAVGRVAAVRPQRRDLAVTLAPVTLTEVFRDAEFSIDRDFQAAPVVYQEIPGLPGAVTDTDTDSTAPRWRSRPSGSNRCRHWTKPFRRRGRAR